MDITKTTKVGKPGIRDGWM